MLNSLNLPERYCLSALVLLSTSFVLFLLSNTSLMKAMKLFFALKKRIGMAQNIDMRNVSLRKKKKVRI